MKTKQTIAKRRVFKPRILPRNKYDWRLLAVVYPLAFSIVIPVAVVWLFAPMILVSQLMGDPVRGLLSLFCQWVLWMVFFLTPMVNRLEMDEEGLHLPGTFKTLHIAWEDIESARVVTIGEMFKASFRWPFRDPSLRFSNSPFTFSQYIRIKHKRGTVYYAANNTEELLTLLLARRATMATTTPWYHSPTVIQPETVQTLNLRRP
jgi:hypothetical protein